ncbi:MAG: type III polyketide synthase [Bacteroidota bacterium]
MRRVQWDLTNSFNIDVQGKIKLAYIQSIGTALPSFATQQAQIAEYMSNRLPLNEEEVRKLRVLYRASGIKQRYSVLQDFRPDFEGDEFFGGTSFPSSKDRMCLFQDEAIQLARVAVTKAVENSSVEKENITHLITVSCTGMYAPGLDIQLIEELSLHTHIERTAINFMGCYAAFNALKAAKNIISANSKARVLVVCVELCSIHLQEKTDDENLLANAIFGDGAAAVILTGDRGKRSLELSHFYSDLALAGKQEMGWYIGDQGFEMRLSSKVPHVIKEGIGDLTSKLLKKVSLTVDEIDFFAIHPGGKRILEVVEEKLGISKEQDAPAREILQSYGNMSSPTILFVIKHIFDQLTTADHDKHLLSFAFGPGLTLESALLKTHVHA